MFCFPLSMLNQFNTEEDSSMNFLSSDLGLFSTDFDYYKTYKIDGKEL